MVNKVQSWFYVLELTISVRYHLWLSLFFPPCLLYYSYWFVILFINFCVKVFHCSPFILYHSLQLANLKTSSLSFAHTTFLFTVACTFLKGKLYSNFLLFFFVKVRKRGGWRKANQIFILFFLKWRGAIKKFLNNVSSLSHPFSSFFSIIDKYFKSESRRLTEELFSWSIK